MAMPAAFDLSGRVAVVTGAGSPDGIGFASAGLLAELGAAVMLSATTGRIEARAGELRAAGFDAAGFIGDLTGEDAASGLVTTALDRWGRLDVVVNNAGGSPYVLASDASAKFSTKIIELNLIGPLLVSQHANVVMQSQEQGGSIVNIASVSGRRPTPGTAAYGAAKAGVESLTSTLAVEWAPKVRVNSVVVGMVETEQSELFYGDEESIAAISANVPLGRLAKPADVGWAAAFLASEAASYISGASLEVHGGGEPPHYLATTNAIK